jgi:hypothetical protein
MIVTTALAVTSTRTGRAWGGICGEGGAPVARLAAKRNAEKVTLAL